ncbi:hypothetical protein TWF694_004645 [Orbilia ellipsospora]|uniref:Uncharacterized protein n=1 Tax=Orbilia ellipsospora TaxID=2528407 RepID=A0AAV9WY06_9PEZI
MELRVLIPVASVLGALLLVTVGLLIAIVIRKRRQRQRVKEWHRHGVVEDNCSISWSDQGLTRGVSVRKGKLVRSHSKRRLKGGAETAAESVRGDNDNYSLRPNMGTLEFMNSISHITGRISPGIGRALSIGSHKTSTVNSEKSRQVSPLPRTDEENRPTLNLVDISKRPSNTSRKKSSHSRSSSRSNLHDTPIPEDMTSQGRDSILLPSPPSSVHILTPTQSRHSRQSQSNSSFTFTPATPRASISLFPLSAPPGHPRRPSAAAQAATATLASHVFPGNIHGTRRPSFLQHSFSADRLPTSPSTSAFDTGPTTLADYADEFAPRPGSQGGGGRPKISQIHIPESNSTSPRAPLSATQNSSEPGSPDNIPDGQSQVQNFQNWGFSETMSADSNSNESGHFPTPYNEVPRPQYTRAPSSAVGNPVLGNTPPRKESYASYAHMRRESIKRDSFGGAIPLRRESHGPSMLRRDSTASFLGTTPPKFATGPRVYQQQNQLHPNPQPQQRDSLVRTYSDRSLQSSYSPTPHDQRLHPMNIIPSINESKSSIVTVSSTGSAASDSFAGNGGLSPPPLQKASFEGSRTDLMDSMDLHLSAMASTKLHHQKPPVTPPWQANGKPFGTVEGHTLAADNSPPNRRLGKAYVPDTVTENSEIPASPTSTITTATLTEASGEGTSPNRSNGMGFRHR